MRNLADGVIIWGGWDEAKVQKAPWDPDAPWWLETVDFIKQEQKLHSRETRLQPRAHHATNKLNAAAQKFGVED